MRQLSKPGKNLKVAKEALDAQVAVEAQQQCQSLCAVLHRKLPQELRTMIYQHLIEQRNATFYDGPDGKVNLVNGSSKISHCFDIDYTGAAMHLEMLKELKHFKIRFDFRHRHSLINTAFDYYHTAYNFDLASVATTVGMIFNSSDIIGRDQVSAQLSELNRLRKESKIHVFVQASGNSADQSLRSFRRVVRASILTLTSLHSLGHQVIIVVNPQYVRASARNSAGSQFSIIPEQGFLYTLSRFKADACAADIKTELVLVRQLALKRSCIKLIFHY